MVGELEAGSMQRGLSEDFDLGKDYMQALKEIPSNSLHTRSFPQALTPTIEGAINGGLYH